MFKSAGRRLKARVGQPVYNTGMKPAPSWAELTVTDLKALPVTAEAAPVRQLVLEVIEGDASAVRKFTELLQPAITLLACARARRMQEVMKIEVDDGDLSHDAWLYVLKGIRVNHKFQYIKNTPPLTKWLSRPECSLSSYVVSIVRSYLIDCQRSIRRSGNAAMGTLPEQEQASHAEEDLALNNFLRLRILKCLPELSARERHLLHLRFYEGLTLLEVAKLFGNTLGEIKSLERSAKQSLKNCLEGKHYAAQH